MASISRDSNGTSRLQFVAPDKTRKTIYLGKIPKRVAEGIKLRVEQILESKFTGYPVTGVTAQWIGELAPKMRKKLVAAGLIDSIRDKKEITLGEHLDGYFERRTDVKESTRVHWTQVCKSLLKYFNSDRLLRDITSAEARDWERWLKTGDARNYRYAERERTQGLAPNTIHKRVSEARQFFQDAVQRELISKNPFDGMKGTVGSNRDRDFFIDRELAAKVMDALPDTEWRLLFALMRFGGLRCPSEILALTWDDVKWAEDKIRVPSPKTEHHEGKGFRLVPIFPELRPYLEDAWDLAENGEKYVITRYRNNSNLRTQFKRYMERAGIETWPKLFQNLRSSCSTELAQEFPAHVAAAWIGHSVEIANKHYWQVTDDDFARAVGKTKAAQNPAQQVHAGPRRGSQVTGSAYKETTALQGSASSRETLQTSRVGDRGLEPLTSWVWTTRSGQLS